jgi:hypothetical protein
MLITVNALNVNVILDQEYRLDSRTDEMTGIHLAVIVTLPTRHTLADSVVVR